MKRPDDIRPHSIWIREDLPDGFFAEMVPNPDWHGMACRVYWGSHGCDRPAGHEGDHWCECCDCEDHPEEGCVGGPPYFGPETHFYGDDVEGWEPPNNEYIVFDLPT